MTAQFALPARPRILVVALRRLGDVLLSTPLIRSVKRGKRHAVSVTGQRRPIVKLNIGVWIERNVRKSELSETSRRF